MSDKKWSVVEHNWSDTSIMAEDHRVCLMSIYDEATEDTQSELEDRQAKEAALIAAAPELLEALTWVRDNPDDNAYWLAKVDSAIAKATGTP